MAKLYNLARMTTATTGTGTLTLGSAVAGFLSFAGAGIADGETVTYAIKDGSNSEIGRGVYTAGGTTLSRTVLKSTNSNNAINLSGSAEIFITPAAEDIVTPTGTQTLTNKTLTSPTITAPVGVDSVNAGPLAGLRNRLINGGMQIWQRATASVADDVYGLDRWNNLAQTAATTLSQLTDVENTTPFMMRITQGQASAQRFGTAQIIEAANCKDLRGQAVTLSARVRCSNSTTLRYAILEWTGTADSVTSDVVSDWTSGTFTAGNFFLGSNLTVTATGSTALTANTLTSVSLSTTLGSSLNNLIVMFWTDSTQAQNSTLDLGKVQLEPGSTATVFERRQNSLEIALAQRYYQRLWGETSTDFLLQAVATAGSQAIAATYTFGTKMRIAPTGTVVGSFNLVNSTVLQIVATFTNGFSVNNGATTGSGSVQINSTGSSTYITFDAEL